MPKYHFDRDEYFFDPNDYQQDKINRQNIADILAFEKLENLVDLDADDMEYLKGEYKND